MPRFRVLAALTAAPLLAACGGGGTATDHRDRPEEVRITYQQPGERLLVVRGDFSDIAFGVRFEEDLMIPWTSGPPLSGPIQEGGIGTWTGTMVGFTDDLQPVSGNTRVEINLGTLEGRTDFTKIMAYPAGTAPTGPGGIQWKTGRLGYTVELRDTGFHGTGGDAGRVSGDLRGYGASRVTGTLMRTDLAAAFGAKR